MTSYDPTSKSYWGRNLSPIELEDRRNEKERQLHRVLTKILHKKRFSSLRQKANDLLDWKTPEKRVNNVYKSPGFWIVPPSNLSFFKYQYPNKSEFKGLYKIPFYLILNEELLDFLRNSSEVKKQKIKLNEKYLKRERKLQQVIDKTEKEINELCFDLYATVSQYAKYLIWAIDTAPEIEDYEKDLYEPFGKTESIEEFETAYYGAVFGSEFAIYELIEFFVREKDRSLHLEIINKLKPLTEKFILFQITKKHFEREKYGDWEKSKDLVKEVLEKIGEIDELTEMKAINVIQGYLPNYNGPDGKGAKLVKPEGPSLTKSNITKVLSDLLKAERDISIGERYIRNKINSLDFKFKCEYWN